MCYNAGKAARQPKRDLPVDIVSEVLARTILSVHAIEGRPWLEHFPELLAECQLHWMLAVMAPLPNLTHNYVAPAVGADGQELILKLGVPDRELLTEIDALRLFDGRGCVQLVAADRERGALLLERLRPGRPLATVEDDEAATSIAVEVMRQLWRHVPAEHPFPSVADWAAGLGRLRKRFDGTSGPLPERLVERAEVLFEELLASMDEPVLLHGDLHHGNILAAERQLWLAIDPKGVVGEPAYEAGSSLRNPFPQLLAGPDPCRRLARRVRQMAEELGFAQERLVGWGLVQAVLAAWWSIEDICSGWEYFVACAELLAGVEI
jgi:streptomycin 6-kinase